MCPVRQKEQALSNESDSFLLERIAGGDEEATAVLIARYLGVIQKIAARFCAVGIEREDFVQEGLIALLCAIRTYSSEKGCSFNTYVRVCALNRMKTAAERVQTGRYTAVSNAVGLEQAENLPSDRRENPEELVIAQETLDWYARSAVCFPNGNGACFCFIWKGMNRRKSRICWKFPPKRCTMRSAV